MKRASMRLALLAAGESRASIPPTLRVTPSHDPHRHGRLRLRLRYIRSQAFLRPADN